MKRNAFVTWLLSGDKKKQEGVEGQLEAVVAGVPVAAPPLAGYTTTNTYSATTEAGMKASNSTTSSESDSTGDPYEDFILHMQSGKRPFRKPGITVKQEFELWLAHRAKTHQAALTAGPRTKAQA